jgi:hypothetical protein
VYPPPVLTQSIQEYIKLRSHMKEVGNLTLFLQLYIIYLILFTSIIVNKLSSFVCAQYPHKYLVLFISKSRVFATSLHNCFTTSLTLGHSQNKCIIVSSANPSNSCRYIGFSGCIFLALSSYLFLIAHNVPIYPPLQSVPFDYLNTIFPALI